MIGAALVLAPQRAGAALGLDVASTTGREIGAVDVVLGAGLATGRPRWPWMAGRAVLNAVLAYRYHRESRRAPDASSRRRARGGAAAMSVLTAVDGALCLALRAGQGVGPGR